MNATDFLKEYYDGISDRAYKYFGCHRSGDGFIFRVFAPNARSVRVLGRFNGWNTSVEPMQKQGAIWEQNILEAKPMDEYKYYIERCDGTFVYKSDPYGFHMCTRPDTASKVYELEGYEWHDEKYRIGKCEKDMLNSAVNIYELHIGSWRRYEDGNCFSYRALAEDLIPYLRKMGYTHVELLPVSEYPLDASWGYQAIGYFAPTSRYGTPHDFMYFVDRCHQSGIGVIIDWVGAHFPKDECGLIEFDGSCIYESPDPVAREHPEWGTRIFDYGRHEVRSFLISNVCYWMREYHVDGIRADAVASMIYLDYARKPGEWHPGQDGSNVNAEAVTLLREINSAAFAVDPQALMIAEESTTFPMVTKPGYDGGLGFNLKWNMGWMHDTLDYMQTDPLMRKGLHDKLTFSMTYAFSENFVLPFSHDEVVHGKRSMIERMHGDYDHKFAGLRVMYGYMMAHPGKKLSFMGNEFGQFIEWDYQKELDWFLLQYDRHRQLKDYVCELNRLYLKNLPLWQNDFDWDGFQWVKVGDRDNSVIVFRRISRDGHEIVAAFNFCPVERENYRIGLPYRCVLSPLLSSDDERFGGYGMQLGRVKAVPNECDGMPYSVGIHLPPLSAVFYKPLYIRR